MKVTEINAKLAEYAATNQTVEFVVDTQKYFLDGLTKNADNLTFMVTRKFFKPMTINALKEALKGANENAECFILNNDKAGDKKPVTELFKNDLFVEVVSQ